LGHDSKKVEITLRQMDNVCVCAYVDVWLAVYRHVCLQNNVTTASLLVQTLNSFTIIISRVSKAFTATDLAGHSARVIIGCPEN
jgi:hypothetical protein